MDVNNKINLNKAAKAEKVDKKGKSSKAKKSEQQSVAPNNEGISKSASKAARAAALALMMTAAAGSMTSCTDVDQVVIDDDEKLIALIMEIIKNNAERDAQWQAKFDIVIELLKQNNCDNKDIINILNNINNNTSKTNKVLDQIEGRLITIEGGINQIVLYAKEDYKNDKEFLAKLDAILNSEIDANLKLEKILEAIDKQNEILLNLTNLVALVGDNLSGKIQQFIEEYQKGTLSLSALLEKIANEAKVSNDYSEEIIAKLDVVINNIKEGNVDSAEALEEIIKLLGDVNAKLDAIICKLKTIINGQKTITKQLDKMNRNNEKFYNEYKNNNISVKNLLAQLVKGVAEINITDTKICAKLDKISQQLEAGQISETEAHAQIIALLGDIDNNTQLEVNNSSAILNELKQIEVDLINGKIDADVALNKVTNLLEQIKVNTDTIINELGDISSQLTNFIESYNNTNDVSNMLLQGIFDNTSKLDVNLKQIIKNQDSAFKQLVKISGQSDVIISELQNLNGKTITKTDLKNILGDFYNQIAPKLDKIAGNEVDLSVVVEAIQNNKTDLTKTNALIEALINVVQSLDLGSLSASDLAELKKLMGDIYNQSSQNASAAHADMLEVIGLLGKIDGNTQGLADALKTIIANQKAAMQQQDKAYDDLKGILNSINSNVSGFKADFNKYAQAVKEANVKVEAANEQKIALLQAILDKKIESTGGSSITIDQLKEALKELNINVPDYTDILNEINNKLGQQMTSDEFKQFFLQHKTDLTKTNAMIENLTNVVQAIDVGTGVDLRKVESLLNQILNKIESGQDASSQIQELKNLTGSTGSTRAATRAAAMEALAQTSSTYIAPEFYVGSHLNGMEQIYLG